MSSYGSFSSTITRNDASTPQPGNMASSFSPSHRRTETAPAMGSSLYYSQQQQGGSQYRDDSQSQMFNFQQSAPAYQSSSSNNVGSAVRVHQFFPTMGETGVPITFLITVRADWARNVGLHLGDRRTGSVPMWTDSNSSRAPSHLIVSFGGIDVETRTERSMAGIEVAFNDSQSDVDLTVVAYVPPYPGSPLSYPSMGGKVTIRIKLVGQMVDPTWEAMASGIEIGEFNYWQVSPKSNLKRSGAQLVDQQHTLRRPASFPNFNTVDGNHVQNSKRRGVEAQAARPTLSHHRSQLSITTMQQQQQVQQQQQLYHQPQQNMAPSSSFTFSPGQVNFASSSVRPQFGGGQYTEEENRRPMQVDANPPLIRSSQLYHTPSVTSFSSGTMPASNTPYDAMASTSSSSPSSSPPIDHQNLNQRATLEIHGDLHDMALGWSHDEWRNGRRLVQFWRKQEGTTIHAVCRPIEQDQYIPNSIVVSCIFWQVTNECYITSVDIIYLLEALVASRFNVEEKNRIRRNLEGLKPKTISKLGKSHDERINAVHEQFFKLVMSFSDPRPRHIEKDIKIFPWKVLAPALHKIISKYSAASTATPPTNHSMSPASSMPSMPSMHHAQSSNSSSSCYKQESSLSSGSSNTNHSPHQYGSNIMTSQNQGLSIDVAASNSAFQDMHVSHPSHDTNLSSSSSSFLSPSISPVKKETSANNSNNSLSTNGASVNFNFSDFVVSPMAFGQTPMSQSQASSQSSPFAPQQQSQQHFNNRMPNQNAPTGLGMDLGMPRKD